MLDTYAQPTVSLEGAPVEAPRTGQPPLRPPARPSPGRAKLEEGRAPPREPHAHFSPWREPSPCWFCSHFQRLVYGGSAAVCQQGTISIHANPGYGCAFFEREPGVDDEPDWRPAPIDPD